MYVVVTDDSTRHSEPALLPTFRVDPASMVWADPDESQEDLEEDRRVETSHLGMRVFGPFESYQEGKLAAALLARDVDCWVISVDPVTTAETLSDT